MTHDELLALLNAKSDSDEVHALRAAAELCATQDEVTIGDKGLFNSGRNSLRDEIIQAIEKELR